LTKAFTFLSTTLVTTVVVFTLFQVLVAPRFNTMDEKLDVIHETLKTNHQILLVEIQSVYKKKGENNG